MKSMIASNVRRIINENGLKQGAVAKRAGYDPKAFSNMLNGRKLVTDTDVINIAKALNASPNELFGISDQAR